MAGDPAAMVLDMLADTIDALNHGRSADAIVITHLLQALDAESAVSIYVDLDDSFEPVALAPDPVAAAPLLAHVTALGTAALDRHVSLHAVPGLGHVVIVLIRPQDPAAPPEGFGRVIAFARSEPFDVGSRAILERACRPLTVLWPRTAQALALQRANTVDFNITGRELQVLELLARGMLATSIASRLNLSPRTVHKHLGNIYDKLGVHDRLVAVSLARSRFLVPDPAA